MKVEIGEATLIHGDCFEVDLPRVDHVITDPPYSARTHKGARTNQRIAPDSAVESGGRKSSAPEALVTFDSWDEAEFGVFCDRLKNRARRWIVMTCDYYHASVYIGLGRDHVRLGAWVKRNPMPQVSGDRPGQGHEAVLIMHGEEKKRWNGGGRPAVWYANVEDRADVPTQKPLALIRQFVEDFTDPGDLVLDPCMGSGTVGVACLERGRKFYGVEKDKERFNIACRRIQVAAMQPQLWDWKG